MIRRLPLRAGPPARAGKAITRGGKIIYRPDPTDAELDRLCADLVKRLAGYRCERCGTQYSTRIGTHGRVICDGLDWAHLITRRRKKTRWLAESTFAACAGCHFYLDGNPHAKILFAVRRLGQARYDALRLQSQAAGKVDRVMVGLALEQELKDLRKLERG